MLGKLAVIVLALACLGCTSGIVSPIGTFSSITLIPEEGEVVGEELRILEAIGAYEYSGTYQLCEGMPGSLQPIVIHIDDKKRVTFTLTHLYEEPLAYPKTFHGQVTKRSITGQFTNSRNDVEVWSLERKPSYWAQESKSGGSVSTKLNAQSTPPNSGDSSGQSSD